MEDDFYVSDLVYAKIKVKEVPELLSYLKKTKKDFYKSYSNYYLNDKSVVKQEMEDLMKKKSSQSPQRKKKKNSKLQNLAFDYFDKLKKLKKEENLQEYFLGKPKILKKMHRERNTDRKLSNYYDRFPSIDKKYILKTPDKKDGDADNKNIPILHNNLSTKISSFKKKVNERKLTENDYQEETPRGSQIRARSNNYRMNRYDSYDKKVSLLPRFSPKMNNIPARAYEFGENALGEIFQSTRQIFKRTVSEANLGNYKFILENKDGSARLKNCGPARTGKNTRIVKDLDDYSKICMKETQRSYNYSLIQQIINKKK